MDISQQIKWLSRMYAVSVACIVLLMFFLVMYFVPSWEPMRFFGYTYESPKACTGSVFRVNYISEIRRGLYTVDYLNGNAYWSDSSGRPIDSIYVEEPMDAHPKQENPSFVRRVTPSVPGTYYIVGDYTLHGKWFGIIPTKQTVEMRGGPVEVLKC